MTDYNDYDRETIMKLAEKALVSNGSPKAQVHFKYTCPKCGERCTLEEPNTLYERGTCFSCGADEPIVKAGFMLAICNI